MPDYREMEILLVEDNPNDVELTLRALQKNNLANKVRVAKDGEEALKIVFPAEQGPETDVSPKVILLDLKLPKINGIEVLQKIKSDERTRNIPVVVVTSSQEDRDLKQCYALGVNSYIQKPVEFEEFMKVLAEIGMYWILVNKAIRR